MHVKELEKIQFIFLGVYLYSVVLLALQWRHSEHDGVSNHQSINCLLNRLFRRRSKKTSKLRVTGLCGEDPPVTGGFLDKGPVTREIFPCDNVIMENGNFLQNTYNSPKVAHQSGI